MNDTNNRITVLRNCSIIEVTCVWDVLYNVESSRQNKNLKLFRFCYELVLCKKLPNIFATRHIAILFYVDVRRNAYL